MTPKRMACLLLLMTGLLALSVPAAAAEPIAEVSAFSGEAYIASTDGARRIVDRQGMPLYNGDKIEVRDGQVAFTYTDGALTRVSKFTTIEVKEEEEESGFLFFKRSRMVRRIKTLIGKVYHKSGSSIKYHIAETPTAVCAIRGSEFIALVTTADGKTYKVRYAVKNGDSDFTGEYQISDFDVLDVIEVDENGNEITGEDVGTGVFQQEGETITDVQITETDEDLDQKLPDDLKDQIRSDLQ